MGDIDAGLATPLEVWQGLAAEGYNVAYRRLPLSRERTPEAADLDVLHKQLLTQPDGVPCWLFIEAANLDVLHMQLLAPEPDGMPCMLFKSPMTLKCRRGRAGHAAAHKQLLT